MSKDKVKRPSKVESIEEYLARGGKVNRIPEASRDPVPDIVRKTVGGEPAVFLSLDEADLFYGTPNKGAKPKKSKPSLKIDLNALPPALRAKFIAKLKEEVDGEEYYEEELEEISGDDEDDDE